MVCRAGRRMAAPLRPLEYVLRHGPKLRVRSRKHYPESHPMSQRVISFHYTLTDPAGKQLDSSAGGQPLTYMEGVGQIISGLERQLKPLNVGDKQRIEVKAVDG